MSRQAKDSSLKRFASAGRPYASLAAVFAAAVLFWSGPAVAAEFTMKPSITLGEEYNDNILLEHVNGKEDTITHAVPAIVFHYQSPFWTWDADYSLDYRHFERGTVGDDSAQTLKLKNRTVLFDNLLFLEAADDLSRVSLNIERDYTQQSLVVNQAEQNIASVRPFAVLRPSDLVAVTTGFQYRETTYTHISSSASASAVDRKDATLFAEATWTPSSRLTISVGVQETRDRNEVENYEQTDVYAGPRYEFDKDSFLYATIGTGHLDYDQSPSREYVSGSAGISEKISATTLSLDWKRSFPEDPLTISTQVDTYTVSFSHILSRSDFAVSATRNDYRDARSNVPTASSTDYRASLNHRFSGRTSLALSAQYQDLEDRTLSPSVRTRTQIYGGAFKHYLTRDLILSLDYSYIRSASPVAVDNNYMNNRAAIRITKEF